MREKKRERERKERKKGLTEREKERGKDRELRRYMGKNAIVGKEKENGKNSLERMGQVKNTKRPSNRLDYNVCSAREERRVYRSFSCTLRSVKNHSLYVYNFFFLYKMLRKT